MAFPLPPEPHTGASAQATSRRHHSRQPPATEPCRSRCLTGPEQRCRLCPSTPVFTTADAATLTPSCSSKGDLEEEAAAGGIKVVGKLFRLHMPHLDGGHHEKEVEEGKPPRKGWIALRVGPEGEEHRRFVVPVACLSHPLFAKLLDEAAAKYGSRPSAAVQGKNSRGHSMPDLDPRTARTRGRDG
ncbi:hypothetical protein ZIOFF_033586 [Zingiber officinale]|uniref:Uncharacterized protein n=1 Tax=Zingiber officinale TaxID=94328 RepID=A0A8J5GJU1_ZINOF|nr:hypothetical protein ZIOFF_033586 [Zingiber officinale]